MPYNFHFSAPTSCYDAKIRIWQVADGQLLHTFSGHSGTVWDVTFSLNGKLLASCGEDKLVRLWDANTGKLLRSLPGHQLNIWTVVFSPDGRKVASGSFDETVKILDTGNWSLTKTLAGPMDCLHSITFSPDSKQLLCGGTDKGIFGQLIQNFFGASDKNKTPTIWLWDLKNSKLLRTFTGHTDDVNAVSFFPGWKRFCQLRRRYADQDLVTFINYDRAKWKLYHKFN